MKDVLTDKVSANGNLPKHIAIIMDGNGRWARLKNLPRAAGHKEGINSVREIVRVCGEIGRAMTFKYQWPNIMLKKTPAVINDPMIIEKEAINKISFSKILGKIFNKE